MGINVKKVKRVLLNSRMAISLSSANNDYIKIKHDEIIYNFHDLDFDLSFIVREFNNDNYVGIYQSGENEYLSSIFYIQCDNNIIELRIGNEDRSIFIQMDYPYTIGEVINITIKNGTIKINTTESSYADFSLYLNTKSLFTFIGSKNGATVFSDIDFLSYKFQNETFKPIDNSNPIIGTEGTNATINTNKIDDYSYIDSIISKPKKALKEFNLGASSPAFRSNGYQLELDKDNLDGLLATDLYPIPSSGTYFFEIELDTTTLMGVTDAQFIMGNADGGSFEWEILLTGTALRFYYNGNVNISLFSFQTTYPNQIVKIKAEYTDTDVNLYINDVLVRNLGSSVRPSTSTDPFSIGRRGTSLQPATLTIHSININDEHIWNFEESLGSEISSDSGKTMSIITNQVNSQEYIDSTVWQKKSFALDFDSGNSEYLSLYNTRSLANDGDYIHIKGIITQPLPLTNNPYLLTNESPLNFLRLLNNGDIRLEYNNGSASVWSNMYSSNEIDLRLEIASGGSIWRITTPESVSSKTRVASVPFTIDTFFKDTFFKGSGVFTGFELYSLEINGEQFNLTQGIGNEVFGSDGTVATINTNALGGIVGSDNNKLVFDSANSDGLIVNKSDYITNASDISVSIEVDIVHGAGDVVYFSMGDFNKFNTGLFLIRLQSNQIAVFISGKLNAGSINPRNDINEGRRIIAVENLGIYIDGVLVDTLTEMLVDIDNSTTTIGVGTGGYFPGFYDQTIYNFNIQAETFNLREGQGTTITGSGGSLGSINTGHASGAEYIKYNVWDNSDMIPSYRTNYGMWQKNGNALVFNSANSDYVELNSTFTLLDGESLSFKFSLTDNNVATLIGSNLTSVIYVKAATTYIQIRDTNQGNLTFSTTINVGEIYDLNVIRTGDNIECFINGTSIGVKATNSLALYNFNQVGRSGGTNYSNLSLHNIEINGETFNFREGKGNTTEGVNGTVANIHTSSLEENYTDKKMWGIDYNKWITF